MDHPLYRAQSQVKRLKVVAILRRLLLNSPIRLFVSLFIFCLGFTASFFQGILFLGELEALTAVIEEAQGVDLWIVQKGSSGFFSSEIGDEVTPSFLLALPGVAEASYFILGSVPFEGEQALLVGYDEQGELGSPEKVLLGDKENIFLDGALLVNQYAALKEPLGLNLGEEVTVGHHQALVGGIVESRARVPLFYTKLTRAYTYLHTAGSGSTFAIVKLASEDYLDEVKGFLEGRYNVGVYSREEFIKKMEKDLLLEIPFVRRFGKMTLFLLLLGLLFSLGSSLYLFFKEGRELLILRLLGASFEMVLLLGLLKQSILFSLSFSIAFLLLLPWFCINALFSFFCWVGTLYWLVLLVTWLGMFPLRREELWRELKSSERFYV